MQILTKQINSYDLFFNNYFVILVMYKIEDDRVFFSNHQVVRDKSRLDDTDAYILDLGLTIYQWNGQGCNKDERFKAIINKYVISEKIKKNLVFVIRLIDSLIHGFNIALHYVYEKTLCSIYIGTIN